MLFEIYPDILFLELFLWNYSTLSITNECFWKSAGRGRLICSALAGTIGILGGILLRCAHLPAALRTFLSAWVALGGVYGMLRIAFPVKGLSNLMKILKSFWVTAAILGSSVMILLRMPFFGGMSGPGRGLGMVLCPLSVVGFRLWNGRKKNTGESLRAVLTAGKRRIEIPALLDTGNSLTEPVSGNPVCVLEGIPEGVLWDENTLFRAIPYHCVGTEKGILKGYRMNGLSIEGDGPTRYFRDVYVAAAPRNNPNQGGETLLLLHPRLLEM